MHNVILSLDGIQRKTFELGDDRVVDGGCVVSLDDSDRAVAECRVLAAQVCSLGWDGLREGRIRVCKGRRIEWRTL